MANKKPGMSREEANQLYDSLKNAMESKYGKKGLESLIAKDKKEKAAQMKQQATASARSAAPSATLNDQLRLQQEMQRAAIARKRIARGARSQKSALLFIICVGILKLGLGVVAATGVMDVKDANASIVAMPPVNPFVQSLSEEEIQLLKTLDSRRAELDERAKKLENKEDEFERKEREFAAKLTGLRELSERLKVEREKGDKKRSLQLDQLASVYSSMGPKEAAQLLEQLDVTIALSLVERMPEKRMAQILSLMDPKRALTLTQMLSHRGTL